MHVVGVSLMSRIVGHGFARGGLRVRSFFLVFRVEFVVRVRLSKWILRLVEWRGFLIWCLDGLLATRSCQQQSVDCDTTDSGRTNYPCSTDCFRF